MSNYYLKENDVLGEVLKNANSGDTLHLFPKTYHEKVIITQQNLTLVSDDKKAKIAYCDCAKKPHEINYESNTFSSFTVGVFALNVTIKNIDIINESCDPKLDGQAIALTVYGDNFKMVGGKIKSLQDSLFLGPLPDDLITRYMGFLPDFVRYQEGELGSRFENVEILGSVDFIFGCGRAVFVNCDIKYISDNRSLGYFLAPAHSLKQKYGFIFLNCNFSNATNSAVYLARPWREYGKCSFLGCKYLGIADGYFDAWSNSQRHLTCRFEMDNLPPFVKNWTKKISDSDLEFFKTLL